jgi:3-phosphoshikimate 1-carboxyvinyltransferase
MRVMMGVLSGRNITAELTGDSSLVKRPMKRVAEPLRLMGANFVLTNNDFAPLTVTGTQLKGIDYQLKIASAQIKTAIIMAGLSAEGTTRITGEIHSRDHTERMLGHFGVKVTTSTDAVSLVGGQKLHSAKIRVPGDPSTAAFWMGAASLIPGAQIEMEHISLNPTRIGFLKVLQRMGAKITTQLTSEYPEPIGTIRIEFGTLKGVRVEEEEVPSMIDEIPLLAVLATQAQGVTEVTGAEELRVKETDRIEAVATNLRAMGAKIEVRPDGFRIEGPQKLHGAAVQSFHDHRIAMAFSIAGLVADGETVIHEPDCVSISYPRFFETLTELTER